MMNTHANELEDNGLDNSSEMITLALFNDPAEAQMARGALEAAGIPCFMQGENANSLVPMAFRAKLLVRPQDKTDACAVLDQAVDSPPSIASVTAAEEADKAERGA